MANNKYSYKRSAGVRGKPIIITAVAALAILGGTLGYIAYKTNADNQIAALKYEFNQGYPKTFNLTETIDPEQDYDKDYLSNSAELSLNTNGSVADSDGDGIIDGDEEKYGTDPLNADSDSDDVLDGIELLAGLNPLSSESKSGKPDSEQNFTHTIKFSEGEFTLSGNAGIFGANVEKLSLYSVEANAGALSAPYEIYSASPFNSAKITFNYNPSVLSVSGIEPKDVNIYKFNPRTKEFTKVNGKLDADNNTISCAVSENGVYLIGADHIVKTVIDEDTKINVHLLIDNSGSMYASNAQYISEENDVNFKRLSFATNLVSKLTNDTEVAISSFTFSFDTLCEFTSNKGESIAAINRIRTIGPGYDGTSVERALMLGLKTFTEETQSERNIIILLTDGISTDTAGYKINDILNNAIAKNVTIMTISLGDDIDRVLLQQIADGTGGKYFPISDANALEGLYSTLIATMSNDIVDEDMDGTPDSYSLYDTGFRAEENGFKFGNFKSADSATNDFGMAALARDWFKGKVLTSHNPDDFETGYDFSNTTLNTEDLLSKVILPSMSSKFINPDNYLNFLSTGEILEVDNNIFKEAQELGWIKRTEDYPNKSGKWTKAEYLVPNYAMGKIRVKYGENDNALLRAIGYYNSFRDAESGFVLSEEKDLDRVKIILGTGSPMVMKMTWEENGEYYSRFVNLIALRRDMDNPNLFNMKIYDTNSAPVDTVTLNRTIKLDNKGTFTGDYTYSASWDGKQVSITFFTTEIK